MRVNIITLADVAKCPDRNLAPEHYRDDGTCLHNDPKPPPPPRMALVVTVEGKPARRYVVVDETELFENVPNGKVPAPEETQPSISDIRWAREHHLGRFSFGARWLRSLGRVDEMYCTQSTWQVVKVERIPYDKVWGDRS